MEIIMNQIKKITSFTVNHTRILPGIYVSRIDGDITTYDLRTRKPNAGNYMSHLTMHSLEHMFATYVRNSKIGNNVIYFGPMGCQTGFYLLVRGLDNVTVFNETKTVLKSIIWHDAPMFGASEVECGNYRNLSINAAKDEAALYLEVLETIDGVLEYPN